MTEDTIGPLLPGGEIAWRIHAYGTVGSTNEIARRLAAAGAPEGTVVVAASQTSGRGRRGTRWHSPRGGLWFSIVLRPRLAPGSAAPLALVAAVAAVRAVRERSGVEARIKWPNDVYTGGAKLGGVVVEAAAAGALVMGVGLNANVPREALPALGAYRPASTLSETGRPVGLAELLAAFLRAFQERYLEFLAGGSRSLHDEWRSLSLLVGERVVARRGRELIEGTAFDIEDDGGIVIRLEGGRREKLMPTGDVTLGPADDARR